MRIGLLSDVHGNDVALAAALKALNGTVEAFFFLGDLSGYYPFVNECVAMWPRMKMLAIRGNHDQVLLNCLEGGAVPPYDYQQKYGNALGRTLRVLSLNGRGLIQSWPRELTFSLNGLVIRLTHGAPWDVLEGRVYPDFTDWGCFAKIAADIIVLGHTHYPFTKEYAGKLIVNPGSIGQSRNQAGIACCAILDLHTRHVELVRVPYSPEKLISDARLHNPQLPYLIEVLTR